MEEAPKATSMDQNGQNDEGPTSHRSLLKRHLLKSLLNVYDIMCLCICYQSHDVYKLYSMRTGAVSCFVTGSPVPITMPSLDKTLGISKSK